MTLNLNKLTSFCIDGKNLNKNKNNSSTQKKSFRARVTMYAMLQLNQISSMIENNDLIEQMEEKADEMNERKRDRQDSGIDDEFNDDIIVDRRQGGAALRGGSGTTK